MAQVYSVNVVGYVSTPLVAGQNALVSNPLNNGTNTLNDLVGSLPAKSSAQLWNGAGYTPSLKGASWSPNLAVPVGTGFFIKSTSTITNTFVGQVAGFTNPAPGYITSGQTTTNHVAGAINVLVGEAIPFTGTLNDTNVNLGTLPAKSSIQVWNGAGYTPSLKGATWSPNLPINPAQGFFLKPSSASVWVQTMP